jgi:AAA domain
MSEGGGNLDADLEPWIDRVLLAKAANAFRAERAKASEAGAPRDRNRSGATPTAIAAAPSRETRPRLRLTMYDEIDDAPRKSWLVERFLGAGELSCFFGAPGAGKSVLVGDLGAHVAAGRPWFGRRVERGGVLYVAAERAGVVKRRLAAFRRHHGLDDLPLAVIEGPADLRNSPSDAALIASYADQLADRTGMPTRFIIAETVSRLLAGGDENSPRDMGALIGNLSRLQEASDHVLTVHHIPADGTQRLRGHGALLGACDVTVRVEKATGHRTATTDKVNDGDEGESVYFDFESVDLHHDADTGITTTAPVVVPREAPAIGASGKPRLTPDQQTMFSILYDAGTRGLLLEDWNEQSRAVGIGTTRKAKLYDIRSALLKKGLICEGVNGWVAKR